ncbi:hypothetical protein J3F84DRAFT_406708 [Trichoderma pleuroticola]
MALNLNDPNGLVNLHNLAQEVERIAPDDNARFHRTPLFGAINYFGGEMDIATLLANRGYTVIVASIAPISTNWERACELYRQLTFGQFNTMNLTTNTLEEENDLDVEYGHYFGPNRGPERTSTINRRRAILYSNSPGFHNWKWDRDHGVHFVCHSQGGNTVRYLIDLMSGNNKNMHPKIPSFDPPEKRAFDLQLDHWGICRNTGETFQGILERLESPDGPVWKWLYSNDNGFYDNSIKGVHELSQKTINTSPNIFYFSLSFHATKPFPTDWPDWGKVALNEFPFKTGIPIPFLGQLTNMVVNGLWKFLPAIVDFPAFVQWITKSVITRVLRIQGCTVVLPSPGEYIPREDVIPIMMPTVYAMGGQQLTQAQREILDPGFEDWLQNDGIVNTASMPGPRGSVRNVGSLPDVDFSIPGKQDVYWHLGVNDTMDHADEIGIFIERDMSVAMQDMYLNIAKLISRLPR